MTPRSSSAAATTPTLLFGLLLLLAASCPRGCYGANPLVPGVGMADPHAHVFPNEPSTVYLFATHDYSNESSRFRMDDWWLWRSTDMVNWVKQAVVPPSVFAWDTAPRSCWATDAAYHNGRYYWYVSAGSADVGVLSSDAPSGPWLDPLGHALLSHEQGAALNPPTTIRDPGTLHDHPDAAGGGEFYLVFGTYEYYVARLAANMTALAEAPRHLLVRNATSQNGVGVLDDKPFLHAHNGTYYLSFGAFYATASSPYGPFDYRGSFIDPTTIAPDFLVGNLTSEPWYKREIFKDRHGAFFERKHQWFFSTNDVSHSTDAHNGNYFRDSVISYVHFGADGAIAPLAINATGVGSYVSGGAGGGWVEAENFMELGGPRASSRKQELVADALAGVKQRQQQQQSATTARFGVVAVGGTTLLFPRVALGSTGAHHGDAVLLLHAANGSPDGRAAHVDVRISTSAAGDHRAHVDGWSLATRCVIAHTGGWSSHTTHRCELGAPLPSSVDVLLTFAAGASLDRLAVETDTVSREPSPW